MQVYGAEYSNVIFRRKTGVPELADLKRRLPATDEACIK